MPTGLDELTLKSWVLKDKLRVLLNLRNDLLKTIAELPHRKSELESDIEHFDGEIAEINEELAVIEAKRKALVE